jgi:CRP-like cAMP-binding protein
MAQKVFVTDAQAKAAQMLVDRDRALGHEPDPATLKIAEARPEHSADRHRGSRGASRPAAVRFWEALDPAEREALQAVASWQTFTAGARLMTEGEQADHVVVILGGRAKISVDENGRERVLAVRGLGQLVGERAALQASVRSATVTALEMVWALVVRSEDFAAFVRNHPRVLDILHDQIFDRLTEKPTEYGRHEELRDHHRRDPAESRAAAGGSYDDVAAGRPPHRIEVLNGENCTVLLSDVVGFDTHARSDDDRILIREALSGIVATALQGITDIWTLNRDDSLLTVLPPSISTAEFMSRLLKELPGAIERHSRSGHASTQLQLRLAINVGPVFGDAAGAAGEAITVASRLLDAPYFKEAIVSSGASLGIVLSPFVYETFIRPGPDLSEVASYTQVPVEIRGSSTIAWMKVISRSRAAKRSQP